LVRFYSESPLVREPDVLLFGIERLDPPEQEFLNKSPMRHVRAADIQKKGAAASTRDALAHLHTETREFVLHLDTDVIAQEEFAAVNVPGSGGLSYEEARQSLREALSQKTLIGLDVAQYNPERDADGSGAKKLVALLVDALSGRLDQAAAVPPAENEPVATAPEAETAAASPEVKETETPAEPVATETAQIESAADAGSDSTATEESSS
jgi:arginase family enzyme